MIYLLISAAIFAGLAYATYVKSKQPQVLYSKLATIMLGFISLFFLYQFVYYYQVGNDIGRFYGNGTGVSYYSNTTGNTTFFYSNEDVAVGEYLVMTRANRDVTEILSGIIPILAIGLGGYFLWYYVEIGLFARKKDRMT